MKVVVNGKNLKFYEDITLLEIMKKLNIESKVMAAAINLEIVKKDSWDKVKIKENDKIELLQFVGGG